MTWLIWYQDRNGDDCQYYTTAENEGEAIRSLEEDIFVRIEAYSAGPEDCTLYVETYVCTMLDGISIADFR
jgi:hypothetical protein